jgi:glycosyltransferase involved in cell wall biosynthesis
MEERVAAPGRVDMTASIIIPAHNEEAVIGRCLDALLGDAEPGEFGVIVVANGCSDRTAEVALEFGDKVVVIDTPTPGKPNALNLGDEAAGDCFPRIYLDGDLVLSTHAARAIARAVGNDGVLAAAPKFRFDLEGASWAVRAYYRIWSLMPYFDTGRIAGAFALSREGRDRFGAFPEIISDDGYVRLHFAPGERVTIETETVTVVAPRTLGDLLKIKTRSKAGTMELRSRYPELFVNETASEGGSLKRMLRIPWLWPQCAVYAHVNLTAKRRARARLARSESLWERDESSRTNAAGKGTVYGS